MLRTFREVNLEFMIGVCFVWNTARGSSVLVPEFDDFWTSHNFMLLSDEQDAKIFPS